MKLDDLTLGQLKPDVHRRFYKNVKKTNSCWLWMGDSYNNGYGRIQVGGRRLGAHRLSYEIHVGPIKDKNVVHHKCGEKLCVNPEHLMSITQSENTIAYYNGNGY